MLLAEGQKHRYLHRCLVPSAKQLYIYIYIYSKLSFVCRGSSPACQKHAAEVFGVLIAPGDNTNDQQHGTWHSCKFARATLQCLVQRQSHQTNLPIGVRSEQLVQRSQQLNRLCWRRHDQTPKHLRLTEAFAKMVTELSFFCLS